MSGIPQKQAYRAFRAAVDASVWWEGLDAAALLRDQLNAEIGTELAPPSRLSGTTAQWWRRPLGDLLTDADAPLELIVLLKEWAKNACRDDEQVLPEMVATVLYYAAIVAIAAHHGTWASTQTRPEVIAACTRLIDYKWLEPRIRELFETWVAAR